MYIYIHTTYIHTCMCHGTSSNLVPDLHLKECILLFTFTLLNFNCSNFRLVRLSIVPVQMPIVICTGTNPNCDLYWYNWQLYQIATCTMTYTYYIYIGAHKAAVSSSHPNTYISMPNILPNDPTTPLTCVRA